MSEIILSCQDIHKKYGDIEVLRGVSMEINSGEIVSIVGSSGAGKTTLLQILGTLDTPDEGNVYYRDKAINILSKSQLAHFRNRHVGFVFQFHRLLPEFTALENVCIPALIAGEHKAKAEVRATEHLKYLGLGHRLRHKPSALSGGEQQRVAVARALMNEPAIILADEPSGNLDSNNAKELHALFVKLREEFQRTFIIVTHNEELAAMADRKLTMRDGLFAN